MERQRLTRLGVTGEEALTEPDAAEGLIRSAARVDVLVANLSSPAPATPDGAPRGKGDRVG